MRHLILILCLFISSVISAQSELEFEVFAGEFSRIDCPVSVDLSATGLELGNLSFQLYQVEGKERTAVQSQLEFGNHPRLFFIVDELKKGKSVKYILSPEKAEKSSSIIEIKKEKGGLQLVQNGNPILNYQFKEVLPPEGVDPIYRRSGFIHPLWSPGGEVLTCIQPDDHYHHYGIWGPWTKTHIEGREVDFWNLVKGQGTVRSSKFLSEVEGDVFSRFSALQEHIDFGAKGGDRPALNEVLDVCAWNLNGKAWMVDYTTTINCPLDSGIMLDAYRYGGGIGFRATEKWHKDNCSVVTSEGNDRLTADGTKARWCIVEGESIVGRSGILFLGHPSNRAFPEPMRVWPIDGNRGRGDMFFEFCPIRHNDWSIEKGKDYSLKYRMIIFDGELTAEEAEQYWQAFAKPPSISIK